MKQLICVVVLALWGGVILFEPTVNRAARSFDCYLVGFSPLGAC